MNKKADAGALLADRIDSLLSEGGNCLCGRGEWCDECSSYSGLNKLRKKLRYLAAELRGQPMPTEDYGRSITILRSALEQAVQKEHEG